MVGCGWLTWERRGFVEAGASWLSLVLKVAFVVLAVLSLALEPVHFALFNHFFY